MGEYAEYGFDKQRAVCSNEGLTLETSAKHHIPQAKNIPYQPLLIKPIFNNIYSTGIPVLSQMEEGDWTDVRNSNFFVEFLFKIFTHG